MKNLVLFLMIICQISATAQLYTVQAKIVDQEKQPLQNVLLTYGENKEYSDLNGVFKISTSEPELSLSLHSLGLKDTIINIKLRDAFTDLGSVMMKESDIIMKEINISATAMPYKGNVQGTNYYISPMAMKKMQPISTEEALKYLPGVNVLGDMGLSNRLNVSIRGSWGRRSEKVLLMEDGSPISPAPYTAPGIYYNPISERISGLEVFTGADVLRYGPNNMFGIINYITFKPTQQPVLKVKLSSGQRGLLSGLMSYGGTWNKIGSQIEAIYKRFDGYTQNSSVKMLNLNAKIFAELSHNQSLYFKISSQFEDNQATLSSITPLSFKIDPTINPFDADRFTMHRYGLDLIHKWAIDESASLSTKVFASDFARDWWRQNNIVLKASQVRAYVGENIFSEKYKYLENAKITDEDYVRVGSINSKGRESTTDSRWHFTVTTAEQTYQKKFEGERWSNSVEVQAKYYRETYKDMVLASDSTRWARNGRFTTDLAYTLNSMSGYVRNHFRYNHFSVIPILRFENVWMYREDRLANASNPNLTTDKDLTRANEYAIFQPGLSLSYRMNEVNWFGSIYKGYIAPSKYFAFLVERDGVLVQPLSQSELSNIKPEVSVNAELGVRGEVIKNTLSGQLAIYNNRIKNFYLAGWNEFFDKLAVINLRGAELSLNWDVLSGNKHHKLTIQPNVTFLNSRVISGELQDRHLFTQIKHTQATKAELLQKYNNNPQSYQFFTKDASGKEVEFKPTSPSDLDKVSKSVFKYGENYISDGKSPYAPKIQFNANVNYSYKKLYFGLSYNFVGDQYAEFANFENESGDGGVGKIDAYSSYDVNLGYDFLFRKTNVTWYLSAKNLGNNVVIGSRLNRGQSGIMPVGFRQINTGVTIDF